jgi:hypothetical protein
MSLCSVRNEMSQSVCLWERCVVIIDRFATNRMEDHEEGNRQLKQFVDLPKTATSRRAKSTLEGKDDVSIVRLCVTASNKSRWTRSLRPAADC